MKINAKCLILYLYFYVSSDFYSNYENLLRKQRYTKKKFRVGFIYRNYCIAITYRKSYMLNVMSAQ